MSDRMKVKIVQSLVGAVVLTILMQIFAITGFGQYIWMLFFPLLLSYMRSFSGLLVYFEKSPYMANRTP